MKRKSLLLFLLLCSVLVPSAAFAEGLCIYEWSAAGSGMAESYMFGENDPAVLAYNPAAITRLDGRYLSVGASFFNPYDHNNFTKLGAANTGNSDSWDNSYSPAVGPYLYYVDKAGANGWWGFAMFPRYGNNIEYDPNWPGRYDTIFSGIKAFTLQPTYAWRMGERWSAAVGLDVNIFMLRMKSASYTGTPYDIFSDLDGSSWNVGGVFALNYDFDKDTSAALVYRTRVRQDIDADVDLSSIIPAYNFSTKAHGVITLPDSLQFGLSHRFNQGRTRVEADLLWTNWTTYDALSINFDDSRLKTKYAVKDWQAAWRFNIGVEHKLSDTWSILGGYCWDQSPVPDEYMDFTMPTGDRHRVSVGLKYRPNANQEWALAYTAIFPSDRTVYSRLNGTDFTTGEISESLTQVIGLGCTIRLK